MCLYTDATSLFAFPCRPLIALCLYTTPKSTKYHCTALWCPFKWCLLYGLKDSPGITFPSSDYNQDSTSSRSTAITSLLLVVFIWEHFYSDNTWCSQTALKENCLAFFNWVEVAIYQAPYVIILCVCEWVSEWLGNSSIQVMCYSSNQ